MSKNTKVGFVYDERMLAHYCPYDTNQMETPDRIRLIRERFLAEGLLDEQKCTLIQATEADDLTISLCNSPILLKELARLKTDQMCEQFCQSRELVYLCEESLGAARVAVGGCIQAARAILEERCWNAFALVRPPGHHSYGDQAGGFCLLNNVAITAKYCLDNIERCKKVLIFDHDIHPPNGTFRCLKDDHRALILSIHNYMYGSAWPFDCEMDSRNDENLVNIPLNAIGLNDADYMAALKYIILPIAREFKPDLIIVSAGYDSALHDLPTKIGQAITAPTYGHIIEEMNAISPGRVLAVLEGGYFAASYTECALMTMRGLMGEDVPAPPPNTKKLSASIVDTIWTCLVDLRTKFQCSRQILDTLNRMQFCRGLPKFTPLYQQKLFLGKAMRDHYDDLISRQKCRTKNWFPLRSVEEIEMANKEIDNYRANYQYNSVCANPEFGSSQSSRKTELNLSSDSEFLVLMWDDAVRNEAYIENAKSVLLFMEKFDSYINSFNGIYLAGDRRNC